MNEKYAPIEQYRKLFDNKRIKDIDRLTNKAHDTDEIYENIKSLTDNCEKAIKNMITEEWIKTKNNTTITKFRAKEGWGFIEYESDKGNNYYDNKVWFTDFLTKNPNNKVEIIKELYDNFDDTCKYIITELKELYNACPNGTIHKTKIPLGKVNKTLFKFFTCPCRTRIGSQMNLIIESSRYGTSYRIPALHYWDINRNEDGRMYLPRKKLNILKIMYYDEIKKGLKEHIKVASVKHIEVKKQLEATKQKLAKYIVAAEI